MRQQLAGKTLSAQLSLRAAIAIAALIACFSIVVALILENSARQQAYEMGDVAAKQAVAEVRTQFELPIGTVRGMRGAIVAARARGVRERGIYDSMLQTTLNDSPGLLATWTAWEPNAFDRRDGEFVNAPGHDGTGRYVPYWHREGIQIALTALTDYEKPGAGDYYLLARDSQKPVLLEPYNYQVGNRMVLMTSIALPVVDQGKGVGVVGADMALDDLQVRMGGIRVPFEGRVSVLSAKRTYAYHHDKAMLGKPADTAPAGEATVDDPVLGKVLRIERPVQFSGFAEPWIVRVDLPWAAVLSTARRIEIALLLASVITICVLAWLVRRAANRIVAAPLAQITEEMVALAGGDLAARERAPAGADELVQMRDALEVFRSNAVAKRSADRQQSEAVDAVGASLSRIAQGDLTARLEGQFEGSFRTLQVDFNAAMERVAVALGAVADSTRAVTTGSNEIQSASEDLALRTERQAAGLAAVTTSMGDINERVRRTTECAAQTDAVVSVFRSEIEASSAVTRSAIEAMSSIERASAEIAQFVSVIDGITFQTNLLALNAGVEAARAGDAGKGFAVVASEVRALAQRSSEAAADIKARVSASSDHVLTGVSLVGQMNEALDRIEARMAEIGQLAVEIATGARDQLASVTEVNGTIQQMDSFTQQNAAMVEESTAAARNLAGLANQLADQVRQFRLPAAGQPARLARAA